MQIPRRHGFAAETGDWHGSYAFSMCLKSFWLKQVTENTRCGKEIL